MTTKQKYGLGAIVAVLILAGLFVLHTLDKNQAVGIARAEEQDKTAEAAEAKANKAIADRDALLKQYEEALAVKIAAVTTPQAAVKVIDHYIPGAPAVVVQHDALPANVQQQLPNAPSYVVQTDEQAEATAKVLLACDGADKALYTCEADRKDDAVKLQAVSADRDAWKNTAKGGTRWQRLKAGAGHMLCGGLATGAGTFAGQRGNAQTGLIVGGGALIGCELLKVR